VSHTTLPRFRFYGSPRNYGTVLAREFIPTRLRREGGVVDLERAIAGFVGQEDAVALPQGRLAVYLATRALVRPDRDEVILSPYTIHDVVNMILAGGGRPVFVDVERNTCNIDASAIADAITDRTAFILPTHLHGLACDMRAIEAVATPRGIPIVEDAAQALGAQAEGRRVGGIGHIGVLSFGRAKNINAFFGGAGVSSDAGVITSMREEVERFALFPRGKLLKRIALCAAADLATLPSVFRAVTFPAIRAGIRRGRPGLSEVVQTERNPQLRSVLPDNYARQLRPAQARTVIDQLASVDVLSDRRRQLARIYNDRLHGVEGLWLPPWREDGSHVYLQYPVQVANRDEVVKQLALRGFDVPIQHLRNTSELEIFAPYLADCPNARAVAASVILLPTYPRYSTAAAEALASALIAVIRGMPVQEG
jgi:perosamine synthetase